MNHENHDGAELREEGAEFSEDGAELLFYQLVLLLLYLSRYTCSVRFFPSRSLLAMALVMVRSSKCSDFRNNKPSTIFVLK
uniref:Uncharacterized protein n=1 Tax=Arundo donax TaxID=35708 RepID=A0A0A9CXZ0_ARUDO